MKKHYVKLTAVIASAVLLVFLLAAVFYTYFITEKTMNECMKGANRRTEEALPGDWGEIDRDTWLRSLYLDCWRHSFFNWGDYGMCAIHDFGEGKMLKAGPFMELTAYRREPGNDSAASGHKFYDDYRIVNGRELYYQDWIILLEPDSEIKASLCFDPIQIDGMCDGVFIYDGTFTYSDWSNHSGETRTYQIGKNEFASDPVPVSEWVEGAEFESLVWCEADGDKRKMNEEAESILRSYFDESPLTIKYGFLTSYRIDFTISKYGVTYAAAVFHPLAIAIEEHIFTYLGLFFVLVVLEALVIFSMKKLYSNRMCYELMRRSLTRGIAHDLKTPLAIIRAYTEDWDYINEAERHEHAERLNAEVDHMASLIGNMLSVSKLDSEEELHPEEVELYAAAAAVREQLKPLIRERGLTVKLLARHEGEKYYVFADPKMILIALSGNEKRVMFFVRNDGPGISETDLKKIWEPFYKGDQARTDRIGSSGMGLAISRSILKLHKAKYGCSSNENETSFWFTIKRVQRNG